MLPMNQKTKLLTKMRILLNLLWHIPFLGFLSAFIAFMFGGLFIITIIGAPLGLGLVETSNFLLLPNTSAMMSKKHFFIEQDHLRKQFNLIVRILYFPFGLILASITLLQISLLYMTIVGKPAALVLYKTIGTFFYPVNIICVPHAVKEKIMQRETKSLAA